jgi:hypothetical protein
MKNIYKRLIFVSFSTLLCSFLTSVDAQNRGGDRASSGNSNGSASGGATPAQRQAPVYNAPTERSAPVYNAPTQRSAPVYNAPVQRSIPNNSAASRIGAAPQRNGVIINQRQGSSNFAPRQGYTPGQRGISQSARIGASAGYRSYPGLPYGRNHLTVRPNGGYYNRGYYGTYYAPRLGFSIGVLPYGYYPFYFGPNQYFYSDGLYYEYENSQYTVVEPPVGAAITTLPGDAQSIVINGEQYYELNGVYYQPVTKDDGTVVYQIAGKDGELTTYTGTDTNTPAPPKIGDIVNNLPQDSRKINIAGQKYYVSPDDYYYQDATDSNNNKVYKIVGTPSDEPAN